MTSSAKSRSSAVTQGLTAAPARAMLRAVGFGDADWDKCLVGVADTANDLTPCNMHLGQLACAARDRIPTAAASPSAFPRSRSVTVSLRDTRECGHL